MKKIIYSLTLAILIFSLIFDLSSCAIWVTLTIKQPTIREGEFPFEITYEIDGERSTIKGVYECEYDGYSSGTRAWVGRIENVYVDDASTRIKTKDYIELFRDGNLIVCCYIGDPGYYMSDPEYTSSISIFEQINPAPGEVFCLLDGVSRHALEKDERDELDAILTEGVEKYGNIIVNSRFSSPVENEYVRNDPSVIFN